MRVVEADEALAALGMQGQRIAQAVEAFRASGQRALPRISPNAFVRIDHEYLAIPSPIAYPDWDRGFAYSPIGVISL